MTSVHRGASIFAGFFTLFQAIIWVVLSIIFVASYTCSFSVPTDETKRQTSYSILYVTYFKGPCHPGQPSPHAWTTNIFMIIYAVISACWIPTSVLLIVAAITKTRGGYGACLYIPWLIITVATLVLDLIATILYGIDISATLTTDDYKIFMNPLPVEITGADGITALPAIEMTLFFSRVIVLWIINFILLMVVIQAERGVAKSTNLSNYTKNITKNRQDLSNADLQDQNRGEGKRWVQVSGEPSPSGRVEEDLRRRDEGASRGGSWGEQDRRHPWVYVDPRARPERSYVEQSRTWSDENNASSMESSPYQPRVFTVDGTPMAEISTPGQQRKNTRTGNSEAERNNPRMMGWSYTQPMGDAIKPKHDSIKGIEKPPVPVPDYTMHIQAPRRYPSILQSKNDPQQQVQHRQRGLESKERIGWGAY